MAETDDTTDVLTSEEGSLDADLGDSTSVGSNHGTEAVDTEEPAANFSSTFGNPFKSTLLPEEIAVKVAGALSGKPRTDTTQHSDGEQAPYHKPSSDAQRHTSYTSQPKLPASSSSAGVLAAGTAFGSPSGLTTISNSHSYARQAAKNAGQPNTSAAFNGNPRPVPTKAPKGRGSLTTVPGSQAPGMKTQPNVAPKAASL